jgi:hypothetical protein
MDLEQLPPAAVAQLGGALGGADDVGQEPFDLLHHRVRQLPQQR